MEPRSGLVVDMSVKLVLTLERQEPLQIESKGAVERRAPKALIIIPYANFEARVDPAGSGAEDLEMRGGRHQRGSDAHVQGGRLSGGERALRDRLDEPDPG